MKKIVFQILILGILLVASHHSFTQVLDTNMWATNGIVNIIAADGNNIFIGGEFTYVGPGTGFGTRLTTSNHNPDMHFPKVNGVINTSVSDGNGGWYIGGSFTKVGSLNRNYIAHINANKTVDPTWNPNPNGPVNIIIINGNDMYVGGDFYTISSRSRWCLAKLYKTTGYAYDNWVNNNFYSVNSIAISGSNIYVCDDSHLVKLNDITGAQDYNWNPNINGALTIIPNGNDIYVGGGFGIRKINDTTGVIDSTWNPNANGAIRTIAISGSEIYVGGDFNNIGGQNRNFIAKLNNTTGLADANWNPNADSSVRVILINGSDVYSGGNFANIGGQKRNKIAKLNNSAGQADLTWASNADNIVNTISIFNNDIYVGGAFRSIGGMIRNHIAKLNKITGSADASWDANANEDVYTIVINGSDIYVGGIFTVIDGQNRNYIAKLNNTTGNADPAWNPNPNYSTYGQIYRMIINGGDLYVHGNFTSIGGQNLYEIAKLNAVTGVADLNWKPVAYSSYTVDLSCFATKGNDIYVGGYYFDNIGGLTYTRLAKLNNTTGAADLAWNPNPNDYVRTILIIGNDLFVCGDFTSICGYSKSYIAKLNCVSGVLNTSWNPNANSWVRTMATDGNYIYAYGQFIDTNNNYHQIAIINAITGSVNSQWNPVFYINPPNAVRINSLVASGGDIFVGGYYSQIDGKQCLNFARFIGPNSEIDEYSSKINNNVVLFPNPSTNTIYIDGLSNTAIAEVYDISGKILLSKRLNENRLDISSLAKGLYFIKLTTAEGSVVRKFVKE